MLLHTQVNGDVQRGKSTIEAFQALTVKRINDSPDCRDKCFTVLGTQLLPWAADVTNKMGRAAAAPTARAAAAAAVEDNGTEEEEEEVNILLSETGSLFRVTAIHYRTRELGKS